MNLKEASFKFCTVLNFGEKLIELESFRMFPSMKKITLSSRRFNQYSECVLSCKKQIEDMAAALNKAEGQIFKIGAEVNPIHTGSETLSKDWLENEVSRFWIYEKSMEGNGSSIVAIGKASIFAVQKQSEQRFLN